MKKACMIVAILAILLILEFSSGWSQEEAVLPAKNTALVVVDMQNDFAAPGGVFASERSMKVVSPIKAVIDKARKADVAIIYTQDYHRLTDWEIRAGRKAHTMEGTPGAEILEVIKPRPQDYVVRKNSFDPWFSSDQLSEILAKRLNNIRYSVVIGLGSDICVYATANGFGIRGYKLILPKDCTEAGSDFGKDLLFRQMRMLYGAQLTDSEELQFK